jgi:hypothetical protein
MAMRLRRPPPTFFSDADTQHALAGVQSMFECVSVHITSVIMLIGCPCKERAKEFTWLMVP